MNDTRPSAFFAALPHPCIIVNGNRRTEKQGRPGNEAMLKGIVCKQKCTLTLNETYVKYISLESSLVEESDAVCCQK